MLGPLEALVGGRPVALGTPRQRALLALLLTQPNRVAPTSRLIDMLWGEEPPASAANLVQGAVSGLRKALGREAIDTRGAGYAVRVEADALDLGCFERLSHAGGVALAEGHFAQAAALLGEALALWRGPALADLADEEGIGPVAARLDEVRLLTLERRLEADVERGRHADVLPEIDALVREHPLREHPWRLLMLALYRSGRQADALAAYREARAALVEELGIEPGPALRELEQAVLAQDPALAPGGPSPTGAARGGSLRSILLVPLGGALDRLLEVAEPLAREPVRELVLAATVAEARELGQASRRVYKHREALLARGAQVRAAAFTSLTPGADLVRLATEQDVDLLLTDAPERLLEDGRLLTMLSQAPCDVAVLVGDRIEPGPVLVPFAGAAHDWAAVELAAWLARNLGAPLRVAGASTGVGGRDASRLLASVSLAVQQALGVPAEPLLVEPAPGALTEAAAGSGVVVIGLTDRWRQEGLGRVRTALAARAPGSTLLVRRGIRPGGLAPREQATRFTWTIAQP
ncbi:MAG: AfsR/SARP family transcriptional regulator [Thermoleophilaceae bacterium]